MMNGPTHSTTLPELDARIANVLGYWDRLRGDRVAPGRVEIRPSEITRHLSRICILERPRAGTVRMRLAGATLSARMGMELRGMPLRALFDLDHRTIAMDAAETAITTPAVSILSLARVDRTGPSPEATMAILPLTDTRGGLTRAIAIYSERPSVTPFVMDIRGRFLVRKSWTIDIPETGPLFPATSGGHGAQVTPMATFRPRPVRSNLQPIIEGPRLEAQTLEHHTKPVFQVIDGGRA
jgi:hypothetical protein